MKRTFRITSWTAAFLLVGGSAITLQAEDGGRCHYGHRPVPPLIKSLDADGNGIIDASEIANAPTALVQLDKNGDGNLSRDELRPGRRKRKEPKDGAKMETDRPGPGEPEVGGTSPLEPEASAE